MNLTCFWTALLYLHVPSIAWLRWCVSSFSTITFFFVSPFSIGPFRRKLLTRYSLTQGVGGVLFLLVCSSPLCGLPFVSAQTCGYWTITQCYFWAGVLEARVTMQMWDTNHCARCHPGAQFSPWTTAASYFPSGPRDLCGTWTVDFSSS